MKICFKEKYIIRIRKMAPFKRQRQPKMTTQALLDFDLGESSSDSDFRIDDYDTDNSKDDEDDDGDGYSTSRATSTTSSSLSDGSDVDHNKDKKNLNNNDHNSEDSTQQLKQLLAESADNPLPIELRAAKALTEKQPCDENNLMQVLKKINNKTDNIPKITLKPICCVCLGDRSDDSNEIVDCDGCGVSVHEGCYGVSDNSSISSTNSTCSTEPWFCEACRADVQEPMCELCPNLGGIYKETDVGKWVHLVCALYIPGVAFGEVDQLSSVTLFEMQYSKWGSKACSLCENSRFARTGVCIGCDAGMCKTYFHVTCAQAAGFLTEAHHEETDVADPFYAHCKVHSEKELIKKRKRNYCILQQNIAEKLRERKLLKLEDPCPAQMRIQRKLLKYQSKYAAHKKTRPQPWVPTQKMSRLLTTSASACRRLLAKAEVMSVDVELMERQEAQIAVLTDIRKKWHVSPAFSVEFIAYYLDRIARIKELKSQLKEMIEQNRILTREQDSLRSNYDETLKKNKDLNTKYEYMIDSIKELQKHIMTLCPNKNLQNPASIDCSLNPMLNNENVTKINKLATTTTTNTPTTISVPTAAALKMGVGFPLVHLGPPGSKMDSTRLLSTHANNSPSNSNSSNLISNTIPIATILSSTPVLSAALMCSSQINIHTLTNPSVVSEVPTYECGICKRLTDQHLLAKCDTCQLHYHLGCLNPPLTRHPKKSKLYGWQCSECDKSDESDILIDIPKGPRKSRTRFNKEGIIVPVDKDEKMNQSNGNSLFRKHCLSDTAPQLKTIGSEKKASALNKTTSPPTTAEEVNDLKRKAPNEDLKDVKLNKQSKISKTANFISEEALLPPPQVTSICIDSLLQSKNENIILNTVTTTSNTNNAITNVAIINNINDKITVNDNNGSPSTPQPVPLPSSPPSLQVPTVTLNEINDNTKSSRKQKRKDRHKNKHNSISDSDKSLNKEHKRKRKKSRRNSEAPSDSTASIPKIKIKFKTLPLPGEETPEAQFFYVPANMVRSAGEASRPTSVETVDDTMPSPTISPSVKSIAPTTNSDDPNQSIRPPPPSTPTSTYTSTTLINTTPKTNKKTVKNISLPLRKTNSRKLATFSQRNNLLSNRRKAGNNANIKNTNINANVNKVLLCCVCQNNGTNTNIVTCDECCQHYHFTCLDPPLKKSPKIRGYSWHCADCDPTEDEKI